jgi:hypothetical protein
MRSHFIAAGVVALACASGGAIWRVVQNAP